MNFGMDFCLCSVFSLACPPTASITLKLLIISDVLGADLQKDFHHDDIQHHLEVVDHLYGESSHVAELGHQVEQLMDCGLQCGLLPWGILQHILRLGRSVQGANDLCHGLLPLFRVQPRVSADGQHRLEAVDHLCCTWR